MDTSVRKSNLIILPTIGKPVPKSRRKTLADLPRNAAWGVWEGWGFGAAKIDAVEGAFVLWQAETR